MEPEREVHAVESDQPNNSKELDDPCSSNELDEPPSSNDLEQLTSSNELSTFNSSGELDYFNSSKEVTEFPDDHAHTNESTDLDELFCFANMSQQNSTSVSSTLEASASGKTPEGVESFEVDSGSYSYMSDDVSDQAGIHDSISAIREEASRTDAIMAVDRLDTLKQELTSLTRQLRCRSSELEELRALVQLKDHRLGNLELERDLHKADADRFKTELQNLEGKIGKATTPATQTTEEQEHTGNGTTISDPPSAATKTAKPEVQQVMLFPRRVEVASRLKPSDTKGSFEYSSLTSEDPTWIPEESELSEDNVPDVSQEMPVLDETESTKGTGRNQENQAKGRRFLRLGRRSSGKTSLSETLSSSIEARHPSPSLQQQELKRSLETALDTSQELRTRLAMVTRYYENRVKLLQESLVEEKSQRMRMQTSLTCQVTKLQRMTSHYCD